MEPEEIKTYELQVDGGREAPVEVRNWLHSLPIDSSPDLELLTHELVTNAVGHTRTERLWLTLLVCPDGVLVQVANEGVGQPHIVKIQPYAESGRGLRWVDDLSDSWGFGGTAATHVWFQLPRIASLG